MSGAFVELIDCPRQHVLAARSRLDQDSRIRRRDRRYRAAPSASPTIRRSVDSTFGDLNLSAARCSCSEFSPFDDLEQKASISACTAFQCNECPQPHRFDGSLLAAYPVIDGLRPETLQSLII
jgi:hypothetical protein